MLIWNFPVTSKKKQTNKDLQYNPGNYTQYLVIIYKGKKSKKDFIFYKNIAVYPELTHFKANVFQEKNLKSKKKWVKLFLIYSL